jgi:hypothetical protein
MRCIDAYKSGPTKAHPSPLGRLGLDGLVLRPGSLLDRLVAFLGVSHGWLLRRFREEVLAGRIGIGRKELLVEGRGLAEVRQADLPSQMGECSVGRLRTTGFS